MYQIEELNVNTGNSEWYDFDNVLSLLNGWGKFKMLPHRLYDLHKLNSEDEWVCIGQLEK